MGKSNTRLLHNGSGAAKFKQPLEISVDSDNNVHVTDWTGLSNKVQKFTSNGTFLRSWGNLGFGLRLYKSRRDRL